MSNEKERQWRGQRLSWQSRQEDEKKDGRAIVNNKYQEKKRDRHLTFHSQKSSPKKK